MKAAVSWRTTLVFKHTSAREKYFLQCGRRSAAADDPRAAPLSREVGDVPFECDVKTVM